ncbi:MAG: hypothetical protein ACSLEY_03870 [Candidatus Saccharimonadales bacterium]
MLVAAERLIDTPVMSLQTGGRLARTKAPVIDPRNLTILAYELQGQHLDIHPSFLRMIDVRELSNMGLIVDSSDEFIGLDDVIKIKEVYEMHFELLGVTVRDSRKRKLGKVTGYSLEPGTFLIIQLNVKRPLLKSFNDTELIIDRSQIVEISDEEIIIKQDETPLSPAKRATSVYANPFRNAGQQPQPETITTQQEHS